MRLSNKLEWVFEDHDKRRGTRAADRDTLLQRVAQELPELNFLVCEFQTYVAFEPQPANPGYWLRRERCHQVGALKNFHTTQLKTEYSDKLSRARIHTAKTESGVFDDEDDDESRAPR